MRTTWVEVMIHSVRYLATLDLVLAAVSLSLLYHPTTCNQLHHLATCKLFINILTDVDR